ncbi:uncharacterized protein N7484_005291 [Penicillium longicatenatum]|uniref:uncharacterized protein n=1 Tax=Penicillium longicatenatum TaxID=1561947 RepID=UPI00254913A5|nr:uncharacterized protein N7484_005291 [Penicillium longicatenatum]KAJ5651568.1 hypothetical protein N7484_005291 [Penicillium longicatenatum]
MTTRTILLVQLCSSQLNIIEDFAEHRVMRPAQSILNHLRSRMVQRSARYLERLRGTATFQPILYQRTRRHRQRAIVEQYMYGLKSGEVGDDRLCETCRRHAVRTLRTDWTGKGVPDKGLCYQTAQNSARLQDA